MRTLWVGFFLLPFLVAAEPADANRKDQDAMQGDWACERLVRDGQALGDDDAGAYFRTVKGNAYTIHRFRKKAGAGTFVLDASKTPKHIDIIPDGAAKGVIIHGLYKIEGGRITMCFGAPKQERPKGFESKEGSGLTLTVWAREKK
jgi:uncharacterized protein (TIGR03067 family)